MENRFLSNYYDPRPAQNQMNIDSKYQVPKILTRTLSLCSTRSISLSWENLNAYSKSQNKFCFEKYNLKKKEQKLDSTFSEVVSIDDQSIKVKENQILFDGIKSTFIHFK